MIRQVLRGGRSDDAETTGGDGPVLRSPRPAMPWLDPPPGPWSVERAYAYCEEFVRAHHEIFPVASRLVPAALRPH